MNKKIFLLLVGAFLAITLTTIGIVLYVKSSLPQLITVEDYKPLLVSQVYDRENKKIGEFFRERRILVPFNKIPEKVIQAFLAAEDSQYYQHSGINILAIFRAALANMRAGRSVQGGSTITQQVAKTLLLSSEKTFTRKLKDILLALEMEKNLSKQDILYLYLNQIYFGQGAYGVELAAQTYFKKSIADVTLPEAAILAGLPQAPSRYSPVYNPQKAKERQLYVLRRMVDERYVSPEEADNAGKEPIKVYVRENYVENAPYFLETVRQLLVNKIGEDFVLDKGIKVYTSLNLQDQLAAQTSVRSGLKELDKRQGYRGPLKNLTDESEIAKFLEDEKKQLISESTPERIILPDGNFAEINFSTTNTKANAKTNSTATNSAINTYTFPFYLKADGSVNGIVEKVDDTLGLVYVKLPDAQGIINFDTMTWARKPNPQVRFDLDQIKKPSEALRAGDVILVKIMNSKFSMPGRISDMKTKNKDFVLPEITNFSELELDQVPIVEGALISFDQKTQEILAMVGGFDYARSEFNRAIQAPRQTGSAFKALAYAAALDRGYNPSTPIMDAPIVYEEPAADSEGQDEDNKDIKVWKPTNHSKSFGGDIIFRNALVKSLNVPSVKIVEDIGLKPVIDYAHRLGIFSPLNNDFTVVLGSSSVTLYEMTKVFSHFGRLGKKIRPLIIKKVVDADGNILAENISLDTRFENEVSAIEQEFNERRAVLFPNEAKSTEPKDPGQIDNSNSETPESLKTETAKSKKDDNKNFDQNFFFQDPEQLIKPETAYIMTSLLKGVVEDRFGTAPRARAVGREVAGKTGSTNNYYDAWFIGYSPQVSTGVWVGFDTEKSLGKGEVGGRAALPIWTEYMKAAHVELPPMTFNAPDNIVFANIDAETGKLASASTKYVLKQAFVEGTEPKAEVNKNEEDSDFYKQDLNE